MKKKICIDARMINSAGIGTYLRTLLQHLKKEPYKIFLLVNSQTVKNEDEFSNYNIIYFDAPIYSLKEQVFFPVKIPKCDLFFSPHFNIPIFPIRAKKRLVTIHDMYHLAFWNKLSLLEKIYAKFVINKAVKLSDKILTVSEFSKSEILKYTKVNQEKIRVIHNAIDTNVFNKALDNEKIQKIKNKLNFPEKYFLFVGNLKPHKNLLNLLKSFEIFQKEYKDYSFIIVGNDKNLINSIDIKQILMNRKDLKNKIKIKSRVSIDELPIIYQLASAFIFPSLYEGFGYPPLEAMSMECPVIVSDQASLPEICKDAAYYVNPYNIKDINRAMKEIIENKNLKRDLIKKGKMRIKSFTIENFIKNHISQIEELL